MTENTTNLRDQAASFLQSDKFKSLVPYLMSGGVGAIAGGALTGRRRKAHGEDRTSYLMRVLRNALIAGGLAGGAHYLGAKGLEKTVGNLTAGSDAITGGSKRDEGPLATTVKNVAFSPLTAASTGVGALAATRGNSTIGAGDTADHRKLFGDAVGKTDAAWLNKAEPSEVSAQIRTANPRTNFPAGDAGDADHLQKLDKADRLRRLAGLPSDAVKDNNLGGLLRKLGLSESTASKVQGGASSLRRRGLGVLGQSTPRAVGRGALGLAAAGIPALIGALVTSKTSDN
jgi:hypothetical protein